MAEIAAAHANKLGHIGLSHATSKQTCNIRGASEGPIDNCIQHVSDIHEKLTEFISSFALDELQD
jgi:hypothetical protein